MYPIPEKLIEWLLSSATPSIRYLVYKNLITGANSMDKMLEEQKNIMEADYIRAIFKEQNKGGFWYSEQHYYGPKFTGSHWSMNLLTELALAPNHPQMQNGAHFMLERMRDFENLKYHSIPLYFNEEMVGFSCYWGNWLRYQIYCGNLEEALVQQVIDFVCRDIHRGGVCPHNADLPCAWGVIRALYGISMIPENRQTDKIQAAIQAGINFILNEFDLVQANYPTPGKIHPTWRQLIFPAFYHTDILFTLRILAELKALGKKETKPALEWLISKQKKDGTWRGSSPYRRRSHPFLTEPDTPSHWVTLHALSVLKSANQQTAE